MKKQIILPVAISLLMIQSCALYHATTVERDKKDGCTVNVILHVGIDGNDTDVNVATAQLNDCFGKTCIIPCNQDSSLGCKVITTVDVKKWSGLSWRERRSFHHINMMDNDGLPSNVDAVGTANGGPLGGHWRRNEPPRTYCHEVLHLAGLDDEYCSRVLNTVNNTVKVEVQCKGGTDPGPGGNCCTPTPAQVRCGQPCPGKANDIMATLSVYVTCSNIMDVVKKAGISDCPAACCVVPPPMTARKKEEPHSAINKIDTLPSSPINHLNYGGTIYTGYSGLRVKDIGGTQKDLYNGFNFGFEGNAMYQVCPHGQVGGDIRLFEVSQMMFSNTTTTGTPPFTYTQMVKRGIRMNTMGIDAVGEWDFYHNFGLFGGPGFTIDVLSQDQLSGTYTFGTTTTPFGDNKYRKMNGASGNGGGVKADVIGCFNLGLKYNIPFMGHSIQPFISSRFPFNQAFTGGSFNGSKDYFFELNFGATFLVK